MLPAISKLTHAAAALLCAALINSTEAASRLHISASAGQAPAQGSVAVARTQDEPSAQATLAEVCADPSVFVGKVVSCRFQLEAELATWNPYLTRFGSDDYRALRVWGDEQLLWKREEWDAPLAVLFVRRGSEVERVLEKAPKYARFEVVARVRQVFLGLPWIELESAQRLAAEIGEGALLHASRALQLIAGQQWQLASDDLDRALIGNLPEAARAELLQLRDECQTHIKRK